VLILRRACGSDMRFLRCSVLGVQSNESDEWLEVKQGLREHCEGRNDHDSEVVDWKRYLPSRRPR
jgi:hypothetical protein